MSKKHFDQFIHPKFLVLVESMAAQGAEVSVVGGTIRDFFLGKKNKHDYDCEIRFPKLQSDEELLEKFYDLQFPESIKKEQLAYNIIRIKYDHFTCEFSLPRVEKFRPGEIHHKNFDVQYTNDLTYQVGFKRRDFTINALAMAYRTSWELIDPLLGKKDLEEKKLRPCSVDFSLDPVRLLRGIRFKVLLQEDFELVLNWKEVRKKLELKHFSEHYLQKEAIKSQRPLVFYIYLFKYFCAFKDTELEQYIKASPPLLDYANHLAKLEYLPLSYINLVRYAFRQEALSEQVKSFPDLSSLASADYRSLTFQEQNQLNWFCRFLDWPQDYQEMALRWFKLDLSIESIVQLRKEKVDVSKTRPDLRKYDKVIQQLKSLLNLT